MTVIRLASWVMTSAVTCHGNALDHALVMIGPRKTNPLPILSTVMSPVVRPTWMLSHTESLYYGCDLVTTGITSDMASSIYLFLAS
ncbi:uncharacterized protein F5147DRAFT_42210 [Suillus discolor]|uniref:Uncharacterized protein n=1 Tax=Suillus discolor TaxID=1912936 RepID=A0A9P7ETY4_9AGAM|nr:uncharacterized protein F5147DRAFT_42210 [Suillus discolor]KAG2089024.1 hypothetical protein F5147DRAFT_42210 [Suillus discolor]